MKKILLVFSVSLILFSCERRVPQEIPVGQLQKEKIATLKAIPTSYGKLVSVTAHAQYAGWSQLWFVDDSSTIRMVRVEFHVNRIHENVLVIPRD